jgi:hypothetical protein
MVTFEIAGYDEWHNELYKVAIDGVPLDGLFGWTELARIIAIEEMRKKGELT